MSTPVLAVSDLDQTLIYSRRSMALRPGDAEPVLHRVEVYDGRPFSFLTAEAARLIAALVARGAFVPITTRTVAQVRRLEAPITSARYAICANGGRLLVDGVEDGAFTAAVRARVAGTSAPLPDVRGVLDRAAAAAPDALTGPIRIADDLFCYAVVARSRVSPAWISALTHAVEPLGWVVSLQGRKLYCVPATLTKGAAAAELAERLGADRLVAAGDSLLDASLLEVAAESIRPRHGELHESGWTGASTRVTEHAGIRAGEEIAAWLVAAVDPAATGPC